MFLLLMSMCPQLAGYQCICPTNIVLFYLSIYLSIYLNILLEISISIYIAFYIDNH